jgi:hypothetical protein
LAEKPNVQQLLYSVDNMEVLEEALGVVDGGTTVLTPTLFYEITVADFEIHFVRALEWMTRA